MHGIAGRRLEGPHNGRRAGLPRGPDAVPRRLQLAQGQVVLGAGGLCLGLGLALSLHMSQEGHVVDWPEHHLVSDVQRLGHLLGGHTCGPGNRTLSHGNKIYNSDVRKIGCDPHLCLRINACPTSIVFMIDRIKGEEEEDAWNQSGTSMSRKM